MRSFIQSLLTETSTILRPNIITFCSYLHNLKDKNRIKKVYICTAAYELNYDTPAGRFFGTYQTSPQELIFDCISASLTTKKCQGSKLLDGIYFTNGKLKSIDLFLKDQMGKEEKGCKKKRGQYIIIDDLPYEKNYEQKITSKKQNKKQKRGNEKTNMFFFHSFFTSSL